MARLGARTPGFGAGAPGNGRLDLVRLPMGEVNGEAPGQEEYGTSLHPFTTSRVDYSTARESKKYPNSAVGKLYFKIGASTYVCSASLIKRGILVTAAHCVVDFGGDWYGSWTFVPARYDSAAPYGTWVADIAWAMTSYVTGTDACAVAGIVCQNDVALLLIKPKGRAFPGTRTGWLGYGYDGYGFVDTGTEVIALINQLGYPVSHDAGLRMQRTDSQGFVDTTLSNNTVWGSRQTGGSSGGPEVVNLGWLASLSGTSVGSEGDMNVVVGVTSWGYNSTLVKQQGASPFTATNIPLLITSACGSRPAACS